jgi:hypothetical protein
VKAAQKRQAAGARRAAARRASFIRWTIGLAVVALIVFGLSQMSNIAYDEDDIAVVDFSDLTSDQRQEALEAANGARCTCGCGMTLAQCVATDSTCPVRQTNIDRIKGMVTQARSSSS